MAVGHLRHLERMGQPRALMVLGEDEDLGLAGQPAEGGGVEDTVAVTLEAGAPHVGLLGHGGGRRRRAPGWRPGRAATPQVLAGGPAQGSASGRSGRAGRTAAADPGV